MVSSLGLCIRCVSSEELHDGVPVTDFAYAANVSNFVPNPYSGSKITSSNASRARDARLCHLGSFCHFDKFERRNAKKFDGLLRFRRWCVVASATVLVGVEAVPVQRRINHVPHCKKCLVIITKIVPLTQCQYDNHHVKSTLLGYLHINISYACNSLQ